MVATCFPPIKIDSVFENPACVRALVEANGPYAPVQRYFTDDEEYKATAGAESRDKPVFIAPVFRGDWAYEEPLIEGVDDLLNHAGFTDAAKSIFGSDFVRPFTLYSNLTWQLPFAQGPGHIDVPEFRGINRTDRPIWLLQTMNHSGLFEAERVPIATTVAWFYKGEDGGFDYWPTGVANPSQAHEGNIFNTAIVGDNDRMFHRVRPTGSTEKGLVAGLTPDAQLVHKGGDDWAIEDGGERRAEFPYDALRISVSWKARVFADTKDEQRFNDHSEDINIDEVWRRFYADLDRRGIAYTETEHPQRDPALIETLSSTYVEEPEPTHAAA
ncbi:MAG: hypothetical protein ACI8W3_003629 [Myxococcota bacterium]|jgi:hypothetical protein